MKPPKDEVRRNDGVRKNDGIPKKDEASEPGTTQRLSNRLSVSTLSDARNPENAIIRSCQYNNGKK
jgi:hypothetical protein